MTGALFINYTSGELIVNSSIFMTKNVLSAQHIRTHTHPVSDVEETLLVCEVEEEEETHRISEESSRQTSKPEIRGRKNT